MKIALAALVLAALPASARAEGLDVKTGAWEVTTKTLMQGMTIPQDAMASMPPEQRAKMEAAMRARSGKVETDTSRTCLTKQDLERGELNKSESKNCTRKVITQNARHLEVEETCAAPESSRSHFKVDATSAESYTASLDVSRGERGKVHIDMSGRWIGAICKKSDAD